MQLDLFSSNNKVRKGKGGPPNRMNDLSYTDWMKFQKSFFRYTSHEQLVKECIEFFTKSIWDDGLPSQSLIIGFPKSETIIPKPRIISSVPLTNKNDLETIIISEINESKKYDFVMINLLGLIQSDKDIETFLQKSGSLLFSKLRSLMYDGRYGVIVIDYLKAGGGRVPYPWIVSSALRSHLKLRDEKIGIVEKGPNVFYCIFFQASNDQQDLSSYTLHQIQTAHELKPIPLWIIPKPPPRSRQEIRHPGKFPETLVSKFIELFTKPGDTVFDPMAGTGSTLIASFQTGRNAYGVDLNKEFVEITKKRIEQVNPTTTLFQNEKRLITKIILGDARNLNTLKEMSNIQFDYCITSPPYWSILSNKGSEYQRSRRLKNLHQTYSVDKRDISNIENYFDFLQTLDNVYTNVAGFLKIGTHLTIIVKNVKREHIVYPIASDLVRLLCSNSGSYEFVGNTFWLQDDIGMKPFAVGIHWVSNVVHQYCLHLRVKK